MCILYISHLIIVYIYLPSQNTSLTIDISAALKTLQMVKLSMDPLHFKSKREAIEYFRANHKKVDLDEKSHKKKQDEKEYFCLRHYFLALIDSKHLIYPLTVTKNERPDFIIDANGLTYGLEIREATSTGDQWRRSKKRNNEEKVQILDGDEHVGSILEIDVANEIIIAMNDKQSKITTYNISPCDLLLYINAEGFFYNENDVISRLILQQNKNDYPSIRQVSVIARENLFYDVTGTLEKFQLSKD